MSFHQRLLNISFLARNLGHKIKIANELITLQNLDYQQKYWKGRLRSNGKLVATYFPQKCGNAIFKCFALKIQFSD